MRIAFGAAVAVEAPQSTIHPASDVAQDSKTVVVDRRRVGQHQNTAAGGLPKVCTATPGNEDAVRSVAVDRIARDVRLSTRVDPQAISIVVADVVGRNAGGRRALNLDPLPVVIDHVWMF